MPTIGPESLPFCIYFQLVIVLPWGSNFEYFVGLLNKIDSGVVNKQSFDGQTEVEFQGLGRCVNRRRQNAAGFHYLNNFVKGF
jgi:hypothetical protein